jgi:hypothetical protein
MKNIKVTKRNIQHVPLEWIKYRYSKISKLLEQHSKEDDCSLKDKAFLLEELKIIENYLKSIQKEDLIEKGYKKNKVEQLELDIPVILREEYLPLVQHHMLEYYRQLKRKEIIKEQIEYLRKSSAAPSKITASYTPQIGSTALSIKSSVETVVMEHEAKIERLLNELKDIDFFIQPISDALIRMTSDQMQVIEAKYSNGKRPEKDIVVISQLGWGKQKFYSIKPVTLIKIATELKII